MTWTNPHRETTATRKCWACGDETPADNPRLRAAYTTRLKNGKPADIATAMLCWRCAHLHYAALRDAAPEPQEAPL